MIVIQITCKILIATQMTCTHTPTFGINLRYDKDGNDVRYDVALIYLPEELRRGGWVVAAVLPSITGWYRVFSNGVGTDINRKLSGERKRT